MGVKLLCVKDSKVLLIQTTYQQGVFLPGGWVKKGEAFEDAARRELFEELGVRVDHLQFFGLYQNNSEGKQDIIVVFLVHIDWSIGDLQLEELRDAQFYAPDALPSGLKGGNRRRVEERASGKRVGVGRW